MLFYFYDDGFSPVGILLLIGFILLEAAFYGFGSAIQSVDEDELKRRRTGETNGRFVCWI